MKITKKLLAVCVAALALSMALMGCNGGSSAKPAGSDAGSAPKQTTEKKESKKPADDRIDFTWFKAYAPEGYDVGRAAEAMAMCLKSSSTASRIATKSSPLA